MPNDSIESIFLYAVNLLSNFLDELITETTTLPTGKALNEDNTEKRNRSIKVTRL